MPGRQAIEQAARTGCIPVPIKGICVLWGPMAETPKPV